MTDNISVEVHEGITFITPESSVMSMDNLSDFKKTITSVYQDHPNDMVIDLSRVSRLDSAVIGYLLYISNTMRLDGKHFGICSVCKNISMVLKLTRLDRGALPVFDDMPHAKSFFREQTA